MPMNREWMKNYQKEWVRNRKASFFAGKKCQVRRCKEPATALTYKDTAKRTARTPWSLGKDKFAKEMLNIRLVCKAHGRRAWIASMKKANPKLDVHGTYSARVRGCRCQPCEIAYSAARHENYRRRRDHSLV